MVFVPLVSVVIQNSEGKILFVIEKKEATKGGLNLPGGHLEFGETLTEGAIREAREEDALVSPKKLKMILEASTRDELGSMDLFCNLSVQA